MTDNERRAFEMVQVKPYVFESKGELKIVKVSNQEPLSNKDIMDILEISEDGE